MGQSQLEDHQAGGDSSRLGLLAAIIRWSGDAIIGMNLAGMITSWNPAAEGMYGYSAREITGQPGTALCPADRAAEFTAATDAIAGGQGVVRYLTLRRRKDGSTIPVSVTVSPVRDQGGVLIGMSSIARDITDQLRTEAELQRQAEDLGQANRNLEAFSCRVSHDLRAPLGAIEGYSDALLDDCGEKLGAAGRGYAERIKAVTEEMAGLIDDLLRFSRVSQAEKRLDVVDLSAEVADIAGELRARETGRKVCLTVQDGVRVRADRALIRTVVRNLLENAWKFTSRRDDPTIEFGASPAAGGRVCCYVRDDGAGFDPAYAGNLFQPFQRLHAAGDFPGTGIGLASVKQIVERHGGQVRAEGTPGAGAIFYFTIDAEGSA